MDKRAYDAWRRDAVSRLLMAVAMLIALFSIGIAGVLLRDVLLPLPRSVVPLVALFIPVGWVAIARVLLIRCPVCARRGLSLDQRATGRAPVLPSAYDPPYRAPALYCRRCDRMFELRRPLVS
jgi:uncharacterized protein YbaR (Trm112 family)